jgi:hypothetical protein
VRVRLKATHLRDVVTSVKHLYDDEGFYTDDPESAHHAAVRGVRRERRDRATRPGFCITLDRAKMVESGVLV